MKLAFNGKAHYTKYDDAYLLYCKRSKKGHCVSPAEYRRLIRSYCSMLADSLETDGIIDLPFDFGSIAAATLTRKAQYRGNKFIGYGKMDWNLGHFDGKLNTFGLVFLPRRTKNKNMRCLGFVANRQLFKKVKKNTEDGKVVPMVFNEEMI